MKTPRSGAVALAVDLPGPRGHLLAPMKLVVAFVGMLAVGFLGCGGSTDTPTDGAVTDTSIGCPLERADGVARAYLVDGGCQYTCTQTPGTPSRSLCPGDTMCRVQNTAQSCDICGHTCSGTTPYCVADSDGFRCSATRTP